MNEILIIGGASLDELHFAGQEAQVAGGAGMYTAAAAHQMGATVTMYAPRPEPMPQVLQPLDERVEWIGPVVQLEDLPHFVISHHADGGTVLEKAAFGSEGLLDPLGLPEDLSGYGLVHLTPVGSVKHQLEFLQACRRRGASRISAGTYPCKVEEEVVHAQEVLEAADIFFMNEQEAIGLFGSVDEARTRTGKLLFITMGERGALVIQGDFRTRVPPIETEVLDPTGAGDTFCGSTLAGIAQGIHPLLAARKATSLAAHMIMAPGPAGLWDSRPQEIRDPRVVLKPDQITRVAERIVSLPEITPFDFIGPELPTVEHPAALDYFFASTLQQFGFWQASQGRYKGPMIAKIDGVISKGSDYLWRAYLRKITWDQPHFFLPPYQAKVSREEMLELFGSDEGKDPMPALDLHLAQAHAYGVDMAGLGLSPGEIVHRANASQDPLGSFLQQLDHIGGYKEDPLRKKSVLLSIILAQRPEGFLQLRKEDSVPPIIDYHLMRSCLRIGLLEVVDTDLRERVVDRKMLTTEEEWAVRYAAFEAIQQVTSFSGKSMGAVDWFFFNARRRCPEMTEPECARCPVDPVCAHRKELFQPVIRTTFY